ncbi:MAG: DUF2752 domain-containing protein [Bacteroidota bacterium]
MNRKLFWKFFEPAFWIAGLSCLAFSNPEEEHMSLCVFKNLGWENCWGCGIGHSISYIFRGDLSASFEEHIFGIPVFIILIVHIVHTLIKIKKTL